MAVNWAQRSTMHKFHNPSFKVKRFRFILQPMIAGALLGCVAGGCAVLVLRLLPGGYSKNQEMLAFVGFALLFSFAGFVDAVRCFCAWLQFRQSQRGQEKSFGSD